MLAQFDPLSEFNILSYVKWDDETLSQLSEEWALRGPEGVTLPEFVHILLKVFPKPDHRKQNQRKNWVHRLMNFFHQVDYNQSKRIQWQDFLSFITACCVFDREKTRVDTVVQYHFEKEITDRSGNFTVLRFLYDSINDHIMSFNANGAVHIYSPTTLNLLRKIKLHGRPINAVFDGAIIPDRNLIALVYPTGIQLVTSLQGCSLAQDIPTPEASHFCIMYEPTSHSLFTGCERGRLHCWRAESWAEKPTRMNWRCVSSTKVTSGKPVTCITLIPNSTSFATGDEDGGLLIWDKKNIRLIHKIPAHKAAIHTIVHSESLHALITGAFETTICVWNPFIPFMISKMDCPSGIVTAMTSLPDSPHLIIADRNGNIHIINSRIMAIVQTFTISPYGQFADRINLTETTQKHLSRALMMTGTFPITALSHCGPRKRFVLGGRMIRFYEYEENIQPMLSDRVPIRVAIMNRQFHVIATCSGQNIRHWEVSSGLMRCVFRKAAPSQITCICMDDSETVLFVGCHEGELISVHFPTGQLLNRIGHAAAEVTSVQYLTKLKMILTASWGGSLTLWENEPDGKRLDLVTDRKDDLLALAVNQKHLIVAAGTGKGDINIWDLRELKLISILRPQKNDTEIMTLAFVEGSGMLVSTDGDGYITFWNVITDQEPSPVSQLPNYYIDSQTSYIMALSICDKFLITGDNYGEARLWDVSQLIQQFPEDRRLYNFDLADYHSTLGQKGQQILVYTKSVTTIDSTNCCLPVGSFQLILKWKAHHGSITSLSTFKANNNQAVVLTSSNDCCVSVWNMKTGLCLGFLQSNPAFGLSERKWTLQYDPKKDSIIPLEEVLAVMDEADRIETPTSSPR